MFDSDRVLDLQLPAFTNPLGVSEHTTASPSGTGEHNSPCAVEPGIASCMTASEDTTKGPCKFMLGVNSRVVVLVLKLM